MKVTTRTSVSETERSANGAKANSEKEGVRIRVYVRAGTSVIEERLVLALGVEKDFEVIVGKEAPERQNDKFRERGRTVLALVSQENTQEDLLSAHAWKAPASGVK